jgi:murein DD-endopeptidase MepM/ murein hydrolase activator NlpD
MGSRHSAVRPRTTSAPTRRNVRRRPGVLLGALVAGGIAAGVLTVQNAPDASAEPTAVSDAIDLAAGDVDELTPQQAITEAEARARLETVAASRAARAAAAEAAEAAAAAAAEAARPTCVLPAKARLTSTFAARWGTFHYGIDLAGPLGTPEYAAKDGVVLRAGPASGFGQAIWVLHDDGYVTVYGHMEKLLVHAGDFVEAGQTIALMGAEGESTGSHLHFEVHKGSTYGNKIDPLPWLRDCGVSI